MITTLVQEAGTDFAPQQLLPACEEGWHKAQRLARPVLVSVSAPTTASHLHAFFAAGASIAQERVYWAQPDGTLAFAGVGSAWHTETQGEQRFRAVTAGWRALIDDAVIVRPAEASAAGPLALSGFSFDAAQGCEQWARFPSGMLQLPRFVLLRTPQGGLLTINMLLHPDSAPQEEAQAALYAVERLLKARMALVTEQRSLALQDLLPAAAWQEKVASAVEAIRAGAFEKVMLARAVQITGVAPFDVARTLERLEADYPGCFLFAVARGEQSFVGASPERLVGLRKGKVSVAALAGTSPRGATAEEDRDLGAALLASHKERHEHEVVVRHIRKTLRELCASIDAPATPILMKMRNVQHLYTPVTARLTGKANVLALVERLHPTPAVGGWPRGAALDFMREYEHLDRGWYAGPIGWIDARGDGEFAVALRSALLDSASATLFAGCGIVADSDPQREYQETLLKLRPMLNALLP